MVVFELSTTLHIYIHCLHSMRKTWSNLHPHHPAYGPSRVVLLAHFIDTFFTLRTCLFVCFAPQGEINSAHLIH